MAPRNRDSRWRLPGVPSFAWRNLLLSAEGGAMRHLIAALAVAAALAGCTASSVNTTTAAKVSAIDYANDDVGSMLIAFDVPLTLEPVPNGSTMIFTLGDRTFTAVLARAD